MQHTWMIATALAATTVVGAHAAAAQTPAPTERTRPQPPSPTTTTQRTTVDNDFLAKATEGGMKEVELGKLASQKASNADVKAFANRMVEDHGKTNAELARIAGNTAPKLSVLKFKDTVEDTDFVVVPVVVRASGLDLRGKTIQIVTTRDFGSIAPEVVEKLNEKWKNYGTVWARVAESDTLTIQIPQEPLTRNCTQPTPR